MAIMRVKIIAPNLWREQLDGKTLEVIDARPAIWCTMVTIAISDLQLVPAIDKVSIELSLYKPPRNPGRTCRVCGKVHHDMESVQCLAAGPDGPIAVLVEGDAYEEFIYPKWKAEADAYESRLSNATAG
jgi:hypothetical protein